MDTITWITTTTVPIDVEARTTKGNEVIQKRKENTKEQPKQTKKSSAIVLLRLTHLQIDRILLM